MSNPTELPDLDRLQGLAQVAKDAGIPLCADLVLDEIALARRAQPECKTMALLKDAARAWIARFALAATAEAPVNSVAMNLEAQLRAVVRERDDLRAQQAAASGALECDARGLVNPSGEQLYVMVTKRFKSGSFPWSMATESGKAAWSAAAAELCFAPDTIMARYSDTAPSAPSTPEAPAAELERLRALVNTPELHDFSKGVVLEAAHQRERWSTSHDAGKAPADWFWLLGYLGGKALKAHIDGNTEKALHHTISTAAACANWHAAVLGKTSMRPGIEPPAEIAAQLDGGQGEGA